MLKDRPAAEEAGAVPSVRPPADEAVVGTERENPAAGAEEVA